MSNRAFITILCCAAFVYLLNLRLDVMQVDAAQYAMMSWEMLLTKSFLQVHCLTANYLDKPPLLFWLNSLSLCIFGVSNFAYKLPSLLFALLAIYSTYRLAKIFYDEKTARMSAIVLATTQAVFLITNDVRCDTLLMGAVIFSIWQWTEFFENGKMLNIFLGAIGVALAMLAKGPIGLVATGAAIVPHQLWKGKWKQLFDIRIAAAVLIIAALLLPMSIGLYQQFGWKGLKFYFWTQSFGRITGESEWNNHVDPFFLVHSTAWAFMPWSVFLFVGWIKTMFDFVKDKFSRYSQHEIISLSGFTLTLLALSLSKYQLPHYIFVTYPLAAVIAARCLIQSNSWGRAKHWMTGVQALILIAIIPVSFLLQYSLKGFEPVSLICLLVLYPLTIWLAIQLNGGLRNHHIAYRYLLYRFRGFYAAIFGRKGKLPASVIFGLDVAHRNLFALSTMVFIAFNFLLSAFYYPEILTYQPQNDFGRYVKATETGDNFICYGIPHDFALVFYAQQVPVELVWNEAQFKEVLNRKLKVIVYATQSAVDALTADKVPFTVIEKRDAYPVSLLSLEFLNPKTREGVCNKVYLLEVIKK